MRRTGIMLGMMNVAVVALLSTQAPAFAEEITFSGYGEMHYNASSEDVNEFDFHRLVFGFGYHFNENISLEAELDFEHAFTEPELEFAHLDFWHRNEVSYRVGAILMPVGPLNESHEPPRFYSVERPNVQKNVIPTTWQEPGAGVFGNAADGALRYRAYLVSGLDASEFRGSDGIRHGRQKAAEAKSDDLAGVARVEWSPVLRATVGASGYYGGAAQGDPALGDAAVAVAEVDGKVSFAGFEVTGLYAAVFIDQADSISVVTGSVVAEEIQGYYGEIAYHVLHVLAPGSEKDLVVFGRYEYFDTHHKVPSGLERNPAYERKVTSAGVSFLPIPNIALKADVEFWRDGADRDWEQANVGVAWMY